MFWINIMIHICAIFLCQHMPDVRWHAALQSKNTNSWKGSNREVFYILNLTLETRLADSGVCVCVSVCVCVCARKHVHTCTCTHFNFISASHPAVKLYVLAFLMTLKAKWIISRRFQCNEFNLKDFILLSSQLEAKVHQREADHKMLAFQFSAFIIAITNSIYHFLAKYRSRKNTLTFIVISEMWIAYSWHIEFFIYLSF